MNYLCLCLSLFGIFAFKNLNRSSLRFCVLAFESTQKQPTHKLKLIYRTTHKKMDKSSHPLRITVKKCEIIIFFLFWFV